MTHLRTPEDKAYDRRKTRFVTAITAGFLVICGALYWTSSSEPSNDIGNREKVTRELAADGFTPSGQELQWRYDSIATERDGFQVRSTDFLIGIGKCAIPVIAEYELNSTQDGFNFIKYTFTNQEGVVLGFANKKDLQDTLGSNACEKLITGLSSQQFDPASDSGN